VQLSGFVDSSAEATSATDIARHVAGVRQVENRLTVKTAADPHAAE
jgi:osmotically-inducible protein OsmY